MSAILGIVMFLPICFVTALVCTTLKKEENEPVLAPSLKMFVMLVLGITLFCLLILAVTHIAGSEYPGAW